jgi:hypothetical protein
MSSRIKLPITDETELWNFVTKVLGVRLPAVAVVPGHCSPWEAFKAAFFAADPLVIWLGSRGFSGKSFSLAALAVSIAVALGVDVSILGGSYQQSLHVRRYLQRFINRQELKGWVAGITQSEVTFSNNAVITALAASQTAVRGPHPCRLLLDEVDEMSPDIFSAALGQPMAAGDIPAGVVCSSTWTFPDGTFAHLLRDAAQRGWPVMTWGYPETVKPHGWLAQSDIERKRATVSANMWMIEYDLGQPSAENRAIAPDCVEAMFDANLGVFDGRSGELVIAEPPEATGIYIHGADLGRKRDFTVHVVLRIDCKPARVVAFYRTQRLPWSVIMGRVNDLRGRYPGRLAFDATGVGDAAGEFLEGQVQGVLMVGARRNDMLNQVITAVEKGEVVSPVIQSFKNDLLYASVDDVFTGGAGHLPDSFSALSLAWTLMSRGATAEEWVAAMEKDSSLTWNIENTLVVEPGQAGAWAAPARMGGY